MTYPYGMKGAPAVGGGIGGLPRRGVPDVKGGALPSPYLFAFGGYDQSLRVVSLIDGAEIHYSTLYSDLAAPTSTTAALTAAAAVRVEFSPNKQSLAFCGGVGANKINRVAVLDIASGIVNTSPDLGASVLSLSWLGDDRLVVARDLSQGEGAVYSVADWSHLSTLSLSGVARNGGACSVSRDGRLIAIGRNHRVRTFDAETYAQIDSIDGVLSTTRIVGCEFTDRFLIVITTGDNAVSRVHFVYDYDNGAISHRHSLIPSPRYNAEGAVWAVTGKERIYTQDFQTGIRGYDVDTGNRILGSGFELEGAGTTGNLSTNRGAISFSKDGSHYLAVGNVFMNADGGPKIVYELPTKPRWADFSF